MDINIKKKDIKIDIDGALGNTSCSTKTYTHDGMVYKLWTNTKKAEGEIKELKDYLKKMEVNYIFSNRAYYGYDRLIEADGIVGFWIVEDELPVNFPE